MALTQQHRSAIYDVWAPQLGEEVTEALIAHFPARDLDEPVTKEFVDLRIADVEVKIAELEVKIAELDVKIAGLRADMREGDAALRADMREGDATLRAEIHQVSERLSAEIHHVSERFSAELHQVVTDLRQDAGTQMRQLTVWLASIVVSLASVAVTIALALGD